MFQSRSEPETWCALVIGNSRHHWALFSGPQLQQTWDCTNPDGLEDLPSQWSEWQSLSPALRQIQQPWPSLWLLSMLPIQAWRHYPQVTLLQLADIPLPDTYSSLGCDRALALWAAGQRYGFPALVIDGGTALTLTGADAQGRFVGGAILPGLGLQLRSLGNLTALPHLPIPQQPPPRWAQSTEEAILSGVLYTAWAGVSHFIHHWQQQFPESAIVFTGGDGQRLLDGIQTVIEPERSSSTTETVPKMRCDRCVYDAALLFQGISQLRAKRLESQ